MRIQSLTSIHENLKWLSWKISLDGTYLTVKQNLVPKGWSIKKIVETLTENKIVNFDASKIEAAINNGLGEAERIGPPFELFEEEKRKFIHLQVSPIQARFSMDVGVLEAGLRITKEDIYFILAEKAIVYGIHRDIIEDLISNDIYGQEFVIASADSPVLGQDAVITEVIPIDPDIQPFLDENGNVDYKTWDNIRQVKKGDVICTRTPPTPGIPGTSVFGHPLSPIPGEDLALPIGMNTQIIDDETKLVASIDGYLYRAGRNICVGNIYIIKGDIDIKTGNIEYSGDVIVKGNVNAGFSVVADGNISIEGFVEAAYIESKKNSVFLKGSVFGLNKTTICAAKNITAGSIQDACVKAGKNLTVVKLIRSCDIETENLEMPRSTGQIISSKVIFRGCVKCGIIGGKTESINEFIFSENERKQFKEELQKTNSLIQRLDKAIDTLQAKLVSMSSIRVTNELEEQKKLFNSQLLTCNSNKSQLAAKRKNLIRLIEIMPDKNDLIVVRQLSPILKFSAFGLCKEYKHELSLLKISWKNGSLKMEST